MGMSSLSLPDAPGRASLLACLVKLRDRARPAHWPSQCAERALEGPDTQGRRLVAVGYARFLFGAHCCGEWRTFFSLWPFIRLALAIVGQNTFH